MSGHLVLYEKRDGVAYVTFNRPDKLNAFNDALLAEFVEAMNRANADRGLRVIVLRGAGRAFSVGGDLSEIHALERGVEDWIDLLHEQLVETYLSVWRSPKCVLAAVHGYCLTGALMLATLCDIIVASEGAQLGNPDARGPSVAGMPVLAYLIGPMRMKELFFTGKRIDAKEAERIGLVAHVYPKDRFDQDVDDLAREIAKMPPIGIRLNKRAINRIYEIMGMIDAFDSLQSYDALAHLWAAEQPGAQDFSQMVREKGLKEAIAWRDRQFKR
ncbi:MAG: enoyl-CoA hydratase/isomerase family protein [Chloroflexi bacterium]|nr:enoyl-CoA hydratase/isomerase family protein [Chloroflexota bacterium]